MAHHLSRRAFLKWGAIAATASALPNTLIACQSAPPPVTETALLNVHNWPKYVNPDTLTNFTNATGIQVALTTFDGNEALAADLKSMQSSLFDIVVPSSYLVRQLIAEQRLLKLDKTQLPNFTNLMPRFQTGRSHDPNSDYSIIKNWGITGIIFNTDLIAEPVTSWADFWALAPKYSGQITVVDEAIEVIGMALKLLGYSYNAEDAQQLQEAEAKLMELRPHVHVVTDYFEGLGNQNIAMSLGWNGDAFEIVDQYKTPIKFAIPTEGTSYFEDDWCIPATAQHPRNAHTFINYLLAPRAAALEATYLGYPAVVEGAVDLMPLPLRSDPTLYPSEAVIAALETIQPLSAAAEQQRAAIWERFVSAR